jgi:hypothetical protein
MARIFSVEFEYNTETYIAVVTITRYNNEKYISVYVPDRELHNILPHGKINFSNNLQELNINTNSKTPLQHLLNSILIEVSAHEEKRPAEGLW